jgi:hypothetical protein
MLTLQCQGWCAHQQLEWSNRAH